MKFYSSKQHTATKLDRIERAVQLIESGATFEHKQGVWRVFTDRQNIPYTVENGTCDYHDFEITLQGEAPSKHIWAVIGAAVVMMIHDLRQATNQTALDAVVATYKVSIQSAPVAFVRIARAEYARIRDSFKAKDAQRQKDEAAAVLIKSQPQNDARYGATDRLLAKVLLNRPKLLILQFGKMPETDFCKKSNI